MRVSSNRNRHVIVGVALLAATGGGAATAIIASGASTPRVVTLAGNQQKILTIRGSGGRDRVEVAGAAPNSITIQADRTISSMRTDCDVSGQATIAFCGPDTEGETVGETIDVRLAEGDDEFGFSDTFSRDSPALRLIAKGAAGADQLVGSDFDDEYEGGTGNDNLRGRPGNDELNGGADRDKCKGGPGHDHVKNCE